MKNEETKKDIEVTEKVGKSAGKTISNYVTNEEMRSHRENIC